MLHYIRRKKDYYREQGKKVIRLILIVDSRSKRRSARLFARLRAAGVPCALCSPDTMAPFRGALVTIVFARDERSVSLASVRAGKTKLIAVDLSGRRMFHPDAQIWDKAPDDALVRFALDLCGEDAAVEAGEQGAAVSAGRLRVAPEGACYGLKLLALTPTERLILFHLALNSGRYCTERELRKFALPASDLRESSSSVKVHVSNINKKALRSVGEKIIACRRSSGYALIAEGGGAPRRSDRPGSIPPFR